MIRLALLTLAVLTTASGKNTAPVAEGAIPTSLQSPRSEDNPDSPFELALASTGSWCTVPQTESLSFRLEENGKTVSLCEDGDVFQYTFGTLGEVPELVYSGPILGRARRSAVLWGEGVSNLTELVDAADQQNASWKVESGARDLRRLSESRETNGFFVVFGMTGLVSETVYVFRRGAGSTRSFQAQADPSTSPRTSWRNTKARRLSWVRRRDRSMFCDKPRDQEGSLTRPIRRPAQHRPCSPGRRAT